MSNVMATLPNIEVAPSVQRRKVCSNAAKTQNLLKFAGVSQTRQQTGWPVTVGVVEVGGVGQAGADTER